MREGVQRREAGEFVSVPLHAHDPPDGLIVGVNAPLDDPFVADESSPCGGYLPTVFREELATDSVGALCGTEETDHWALAEGFIYIDGIVREPCEIGFPAFFELPSAADFLAQAIDEENILGHQCDEAGDIMRVNLVDEGEGDIGCGPLHRAPIVLSHIAV